MIHSFMQCLDAFRLLSHYLNQLWRIANLKIKMNYLAITSFEKYRMNEFRELSDYITLLQKYLYIARASVQNMGQKMSGPHNSNG